MPLPNLPTLGIRFDITKFDSASYGIECWKIFWRCAGTKLLRVALLYEGDTSVTLNGDESVFCIAVQTMDPHMLDLVRQSFLQSQEFQKTKASPEFIEHPLAQREPLPEAGRIDALGNLTGDAYNARIALAYVNNSK